MEKGTLFGYYVCWEAPGKQEDEQGEPFVGAAGNLLDKIFAAAGINRMMCLLLMLPNVDPGQPVSRPDEVETCRWYLNAQIKFIDPLIIVCLGALATKTLINPQAESRHPRSMV